MTATFAPPDVEADVVAALGAAGLGVPVSTRVPNPRPSSFLRVSVGSTFADTDVSGRVLLIVEAWAANDTAASDLARAVWPVVDSWRGAQVGGSWVAHTAPTFPQPNPDELSGSPRYQFTSELVVAVNRA